VNQTKYVRGIFSEQTFSDMYTEIHDDISHFNQDSRLIKVVLHVKMQKNHKVFSQLPATLTSLLPVGYSLFGA